MNALEAAFSGRVGMGDGSLPFQGYTLTLPYGGYVPPRGVPPPAGMVMTYPPSAANDFQGGWTYGPAQNPQPLGPPAPTPKTADQIIQSYQAQVPAAVAATSASLGASINNLSRGGGSSFSAGDRWQVVVTGPANSPVTVTGTLNGNSNGQRTPMGSTDSSGRLTLSGTFANADQGAWTEAWYVDGQLAGSFSFAVSPAVSTSNPPANNAGAGSSNQPGTVTTTTSTTAATPDTILGMSPVVALLLGGGLLVLMLHGKGR